MNLLVISQYYPPESALIAVDVATELSRRGHKVRVLTGYPNYPVGRIFPGYRQRWRHREVREGVDILRVPLFPDHSQSFLRRILNYLSFGLSAATACGFGRKADVIYVYATQMTPALGPWLWRITGGAPYVLHVQDLWPDSILGSSISGRGMKARAIQKLLNPWLSSVYKRASSIIGIAPTMVATLRDRNVSQDQLELVYNWSADISQTTSTLARASSRPGTRIIYAGNLGEMQDLETAVRAAANGAAYGLELVLVGDGIAREALMTLANSLQARNIEFRDAVPREEMPDLYAEADFGLVTLKDLPVFRGTVPSKFQALLAHGLPVITTVQGDVHELTNEYQVGFTARAESVSSLEDAFRRAAEYPERNRVLMAERARKTAEKLFSKRASITAIELILQRAAKKGNNND